MTKMSEELVALVDVVGYMEVVKGQNADGQLEDKRIIRVQPSEKYESKDRTGQLGAIIEPNFEKIVDACQGNKVFAWSSVKAIENDDKKKNDDGSVDPAQVPDEKEESTTKTSAKSKLDGALKKKASK